MFVNAWNCFVRICLVDDKSIIDHWTNGIPDSNHNKLILYTYKTVSEFKQKFKMYENMFNVQNKSLSHFNTFHNKRTNVWQSNVPSTTKNLTNLNNKFKNTDEFNTKIDKNEKCMSY